MRAVPHHETALGEPVQRGRQQRRAAGQGRAEQDQAGPLDVDDDRGSVAERALERSHETLAVPTVASTRTRRFFAVIIR